jgi:hypothetical protein
MSALSKRGLTQIDTRHAHGISSFALHPLLLACLDTISAKIVVQSWFSDDKNNNMGYNVDAIANQLKHH